jgi:thiamine pyrophosphokinase
MRAVRPSAAVLALRGARAGLVRRAVAIATTLAGRPLLVAVDGGLAACRAARRTPDLLVGDADSGPAPPPGVPAVRYPRDKDFSDFCAALGASSEHGVELVVVAGLLGGRLDHEWANLLEVGRHAPAFAAVIAPSARGTILVTSRGCRADTPAACTFSLLALGAGATVTLTGARWTLRRARLAPGSRGLSNESLGRLALTVHAGVAALVLPEPAGVSLRLARRVRR